MLLRVLIVGLGLAYVGYRLSLALRIVRAHRRGDAERERSLRRQSFWALQGVILIALLAFVALFTVLGIQHH